MTSTVEYLGDLRTKNVHLKSKEEVLTDAPIDNKGKGEKFSPTDLLATSLASCMLTIVGIKANESDFTIEGASAEVTKIMSSNPRRVSEVMVHLIFPQQDYSEKQKVIIKNSALNCPVAKSLSSELKQTVSFTFG